MQVTTQQVPINPTTETQLQQNPYVQHAVEAAHIYGLNPGLFVGQLNQESSFNPGASNPSGARGIAQFMPATAAEQAQYFGVSLQQFWNDPFLQIDAAAHYMSQLLATTQSHGLPDSSAYAAYDAGIGNILAYGGTPHPGWLSPYSHTDVGTEATQYVQAIFGQQGVGLTNIVNGIESMFHLPTTGVDPEVQPFLPIGTPSPPSTGGGSNGTNPPSSGGTVIPTPFGNITIPAPTLPPGVQNALDGFSGVGTDLTKLLQTLASRSFWVRNGLLLLATVLIIFGLLQIGQSLIPSDVKSAVRSIAS